MWKKIALISVVALGLSSPVFAEDDAAADVNNVNNNNDFNAEASSVYFGAQAGLADMHYGDNSYTLQRDTADSNKFAARGYLGYAFTPFLGLELGYGYYGRPELKDNVTGNTQDFVQQGIDLQGRITLPLDYGFAIYVKAGPQWIHRSGVGSRGGCFVDKDPNGKVTGVGGLGIAYYFAPNIGLDVSWAHSLSVGDLPKMDFYALGLIYKINM
ncbi:MAG: outer membrane beta-barrel protein [Gammaproteobacteria bacterium]|nr:outer membrane beta-barrel protein [Gammaproteobacteria bacterium]